MITDLAQLMSTEQNSISERQRLMQIADFTISQAAIDSYRPNIFEIVINIELQLKSRILVISVNAPRPCKCRIFYLDVLIS